MEGNSLLGSSRLTPAEARAVQFPSQMLSGYSVRAVEAFRSRAVEELGHLTLALTERAEREAGLMAEVGELQQTVRHLRDSRSGPQVVLPDEQQAVRILRTAQAQADSFVNGARHQADQMTEHARQQSGTMIEQARQQAQAERDAIVTAATADAHRQVDFLLQLAKDVGAALGADLEALVRKVSDWDGQVRDGAPVPPSGPLPVIPPQSASLEGGPV